jgi:[ribosomal protein S5]-alanine N-acetyltransferase
MTFPRLDLDEVSVLPFEPRHMTQRYVSWLNDADVVRYSEQRHRQHTLESCAAYVEGMRSSGNPLLAIEARHGELGHIGNIGISIDRPNGIADVSIIVGEKRAWGTGLASQAWCAVLAELLAHQRIRKVTAGTMSVNEPMLRLMSRSSMQVESVRRRQFVWNGSEVDLVQAARFFDDSSSAPRRSTVAVET